MNQKRLFTFVINPVIIYDNNDLPEGAIIIKHTDKRVNNKICQTMIKDIASKKYVKWLNNNIFGFLREWGFLYDITITNIIYKSGFSFLVSASLNSDKPMTIAKLKKEVNDSFQHSYSSGEPFKYYKDKKTSSTFYNTIRPYRTKQATDYKFIS